MVEIEDGRNVVEEVENIWCDLPYDLLSLIKSRLFAGDYSSFGAVCTLWRSITIPIRPIPPPIDCPLSCSPWLISIHNDITMIFHPLYNGFYSMDIPELYGANILCSKYSWLLVSIHYTIFFFNPFTREKIDLPDIPLREFTSISFTSPPTSNDCLVIAFWAFGHTVEIGLLRRGRQNWNTYNYESVEQFHCSGCCPVLFNKLYYFLSIYGNVGIFDPKNLISWKIVVKPFEPDLYHSFVQSFFSELDGKLVAAFLSRDGNVQFFSLDLTNMVWQPEKSVGDKMLFVSCGSAFSKRAVVKGMSNKIYFPIFSGEKGVFYSLSTNRFHSFHGSDSSTANQMRRLPFGAWIEPTFETISHEKLIW